MTTTVTTLALDLVESAAYGGTALALAAGLLATVVVLIVGREGIRPAERSRIGPAGGPLMIGLVPLLVTAAVVLAAQVATVLGIASG